ncbi:SAV_6107 family HEPN domain-containing protein [Actinotalea sp. M2MS4P-6]|uniref:SAV_6107 family HEPN domain-containing protein n=1 Tax=Actinotalea sp. M2MS4P-6 TaxID=2983762 RepID=UPI0021E37304|nr:SAV_6107 family HEPN domain-containing protein [Actinotalea sp. M2MS4P-6]MCV2393434.1 SAV_6107 family HEPN domain-containing protein [Actinotalea sp. M2MS4P-6]
MRTAPAGGARGDGSPPDRAGRLAKAAEALLERSDAELVAADLASDPDERFVHAHLAALRAGAAVLTVNPTRRRAPRAVWELVAAAAPELAGWCAHFAAAAPVRASIETGRGGVDHARADRAAEDAAAFADAVRAHLQGGVAELRVS